jgi:hypothetical protein
LKRQVDEIDRRLQQRLELFEIDVHEVDRQAKLEERELVAQARELEHEVFADGDAEEHIPGLRDV